MSSSLDQNGEESDGPLLTVDKGLSEMVETGIEHASGFGPTIDFSGHAPGSIVRDGKGRPIGVAPDLSSSEATGIASRHADVAFLRRYLSIPRYDPETWRAWNVLNDFLEHYWTGAPAGQTTGGMFGVIIGPPGKGKSTLLRTLATRFSEINGHRLGEKVMWRGSSGRSEWLALAPVVRLLIPQNAKVSALLKPMDPRLEPLEDLDLGNYVREVVTYSDPVDLVDKARAGGINVWYPDPTFRGAEELLESIESMAYDTPAGDRTEIFAAGDPTPHYAIAVLLASVEGRKTSTPISHIWDEIGDVAPESSSKDGFASYQKVHELGGALAKDIRKRNVTIAGAGHHEGDIAAPWRHRMHYRLYTAGRATPTGGSGLIGFGGESPFRHNVNKGKQAGAGTIFDSENFEEITWPNAQSPLPEYTLRIEVSR